jgi:putative endonuclease
MPYYIYILRNEESGTLYTGYTSDLAKRLARHNDKSRITKRYTKKYEGNWALMHSEEYATRSEAMQRESFLKSGKGRVWIEKNVDTGR